MMKSIYQVMLAVLVAMAVSSLASRLSQQEALAHRRGNVVKEVHDDTGTELVVDGGYSAP